MRKFGLLLISVLFLSFAQAQDAKFQAMAIYNFTRTLQWPQDSQTGNFVITVLDDGDLYNELVSFTEGKKVRGEQKIVVQKASGMNIGKCQILVVPKSRNSELVKIAGNYTSSGTLIVTEQSNQVKKGAAVSFFKDDSDVIRYQYNAANISSQNISVSTSFKQIGEEQE